MSAIINNLFSSCFRERVWRKTFFNEQIIFYMSPFYVFILHAYKVYIILHTINRTQVTLRPSQWRIQGFLEVSTAVHYPQDTPCAEYELLGTFADSYILIFPKSVTTQRFYNETMTLKILKQFLAYQYNFISCFQFTTKEKSNLIAKYNYFCIKKTNLRTFKAIAINFCSSNHKPYVLLASRIIYTDIVKETGIIGRVLWDIFYD